MSPPYASGDAVRRRLSVREEPDSRETYENQSPGISAEIGGVRFQRRILANAARERESFFTVASPRTVVGGAVSPASHAVAELVRGRDRRRRGRVACGERVAVLRRRVLCAGGLLPRTKCRRPEALNSTRPPVSSFFGFDVRLLGRVPRPGGYRLEITPEAT